MSKLSPAAKMELIQEMAEEGLLTLKDFEKILGITSIQLGEPPPDFNDGEDEVEY